MLEIREILTEVFKGILGYEPQLKANRIVMC